MKKLLAFGVSIISIFIFLGLMPVHGEADIYENVMRLHVVANSDSEEDQALKLKVRDTVLSVVSDMCEKNECQSIEEACKAVEGHIDEIKVAAEKKIAAEGYSYPICVTLGEENYPTRNYETLAFPGGEYISLQVKIGKGEGKNWWCVLFPPLCLWAASEAAPVAEDALVNIGFSGEQYKIITQSDDVTYNVRFKILETLEGVIS